MKTLLQSLKRIPRTLRYKDMGKIAVSCEFSSVHPDNRFIFVKLLENGAGYKIGHILAVPKNSIIENELSDLQKDILDQRPEWRS